MERCLVAAQVDSDIFVSQTLPEVYDIADVGHRYNTLLADSLADGGDELVEVFVQLVYPSLLKALAGC